MHSYNASLVPWEPNLDFDFAAVPSISEAVYVFVFGKFLACSLDMGLHKLPEVGWKK